MVLEQRTVVDKGSTCLHLNCLAPGARFVKITGWVFVEQTFLIDCELASGVDSVAKPKWFSLLKITDEDIC